MASLKKDLTREQLDAVQALEARADECWRALDLVRHPSNVAVWALLTGGVAKVERAQSARGGSNTPHFDALLGNLSRLLAIGVKWALRHGRPGLLDRSWTHELSAAVDQAMPVATAYSHFEVCFQAFHK